MVGHFQIMLMFVFYFIENKSFIHYLSTNGIQNLKEIWLESLYAIWGEISLFAHLYFEHKNGY